jgi:hypothetical protein
VGSVVRRLAGPVVLAEGVALVLLCLGYGISLLVGHPHNRGLALSGAGFGLFVGIGLGYAGRDLWRSRRWPWSPAFLAQLLMLPVGIGLIQGGHSWYGVAVLAPAAIAGLLLIAGSRPE